MNDLLTYLPIKDLKYRWFHMIDYNESGLQKGHDHDKTEDYSFILYLTTCKDGGETVFKKDDKTIEIKPEKNKLVFFDAKIWHEGNSTIDHKKVAVGALIKV